MRKLPVGLQSFRKIIEDGYVYADKTREIHRLLQDGSYYFLSRPRRFGKSLLLDTMRELFLGNRELFEGLWIAGPESDYGFEPYPVVRIDMTQMSIKDAEALESSLTDYMLKQAQAENVEIDSGISSDVFRALIETLAAKHGRRVVVLVDEYDKPIVDHVDAPEKAQANREVLGNFYGILKGQDANLHFVFLTGVSKFTKLSLFSKLNNLNDITLRAPYANICGITEAEFDALFSAEFDAATRERVFGWYDGFSWDGETRVFNPFSLLSYLRDREFNSYWYSTGTPTFLAKVFEARPAEYADIQGVTVTERMLDSHDIENAPLVSLLFQTGFLTVTAADRKAEPPRYILGFPNTEVSSSLAELFLAAAPQIADPYGSALINGLQDALDEGRPEGIAAPLEGLYASIPYELHIGAEAFYHALFLAVMQFLGFRVQGEVSVARGRIDGVLERPNGRTYVIEFKYTAEASEEALDAALGAAFSQIADREYAARYAGTGREVYRLGIAVAGRGKVGIVWEKMRERSGPC
ncbi:MAG: ATP-binding protein [Coriobacteriales bacterium]|nr:ATP-binding protein [Coriobacteriales bacterium]